MSGDTASAPFYIQSKIGLGDWVLTANADTQSVHLGHKAPTVDLHQLWQREQTARGGFFLVNLGTNKVLQRTSSQGGQVVLAQRNETDADMLWRQEQFGQWIGINTLVDWEQKLNVAGNGPYTETTPIILWEYSGGADNESWAFAPVVDPTPPSPAQGFYIQSKTGSENYVLSAGTDGTTVHLAAINATMDPNQIWFRQDDPRNGFFLYNLGAHKVLQRTTSQGGQVVLAPKNYADTNMLWRQEQFGEWVGINTLVDWEQKLNVAGDGPYSETTPIILWEYSGGADNESWRCLPVLPPVSRAQLDEMITLFGPLMKLHSQEKYLMDDPDVVLQSGLNQLAWGLVHNEEDYDTFALDGVTSLPIASATKLQDAVKQAKADPRATDPDFRYWLQLDDSLKGGNQARARALVVVQVMPAFVDLEFWFFYPYNGPGKFRVTVGNILTDHVEMSTCGRHYGDWEHVTLRVGSEAQSGQSWRLLDAYLSRHTLSAWVKTMSSLQFAGQHPIIYIARDSHAHYSSSGSQYYERPWSRSFGLGTAAVDLEDWTSDGPAFDTSNPNNYRIVASNVPTHGVRVPAWWTFDGRWGQHERLTYDYEIKDSTTGTHIYTYTYSEVGVGPDGPISDKGD